MFDYGKLTMTNKLKKCPIIEVSNKLGTRIDLLRMFYLIYYHMTRYLR